MHINLDKSQFSVFGEEGLPEHYPVPKEIDGLLFYIQRNLNNNTVVYALNKNHDNLINEDYPMDVFWLKYTSKGEIQALNYIQSKLVFGYRANKIDNKTFEFHMVSYDKLRFFIVEDEKGHHKTITKINGKDAYLSNIYVYADEFGLFPDVKYIELFGNEVDGSFPCYQKIMI